MAACILSNKEYDKASTILDGKLAPYLDNGKYSSEDLAFALKIAVNSGIWIDFC